jgi:hypothetical protein
MLFKWLFAPATEIEILLYCDENYDYWVGELVSDSGPCA